MLLWSFKVLPNPASFSRLVQRKPDLFDRIIFWSIVVIFWCTFPEVPGYSQESKIDNLILALEETNDFEKRRLIVEQIKQFEGEALAGFDNLPEGLSRQTELLLEKVRLEIEQALDTRAVQSSKINLSGKFSLKSALDEIENQTGVHFKISASNQQLKNIDIQDSNYWRGLDQVLSLFEADLYQFSKPGELMVIDSERKMSREKNTCYPGIFRLEATEYSNVNYLDGSHSSVDRLWLNIQWEPKLTPYQLEFDHGSLVIVDSAGTARKSQLAGKIKLNVAEKDTAKRIEVRFEHIPRDVAGIQSLGGKLKMKALVGQTKFRFPRVSQSKSGFQRKSEVTIKVLSTQVADSQLKVAMQFEFDNPGDALESHRGWMFQNEVFLTDPKLNRIFPNKTLTTLQEKDRMGFSFSFRIDGKPQDYDFVYQSPTSIREIPVEWRLGPIALD